MGKTKQQTAEELPVATLDGEPVTTEELPVVDIDDEGPAEHKGEKITAADMEKKLPQIRLNADMSELFGSDKITSLVDDNDGDQKDIYPTDAGDSKRFVLAKYVGAANSQSSQHIQRAKGIKATFPQGKWRLTQMAFIKAAWTSGYMSFKDAPSGTHKIPQNNHPTFQIQEIPKKSNSVETIEKFKQKLEKTQGREFIYAHDDFL